MSITNQKFFKHDVVLFFDANGSNHKLIYLTDVHFNTENGIYKIKGNYTVVNNIDVVNNNKGLLISDLSKSFHHDHQQPNATDLLGRFEHLNLITLFNLPLDLCSCSY